MSRSPIWLQAPFASIRVSAYENVRFWDPELLDNLERQFLNPEIFEFSFSSRDF